MEEHKENQKKYFVAGLITVGIVLISIAFVLAIKSYMDQEDKLQFKSIDTMKYSRDLAREKLSDQNFGKVIEAHVKAIAQTGATHIGIATPYDDEFLPILKKWVNAARKNGLKVWFRGNFSGWEEWFGYKRITRQEHLKKTQEFVKANADLFEDGDVFTGCPECENGGPGDPRHTKDVVGHRDFLVAEFEITQKAFREMGKEVISNYDSMNYDVAKLIMDRETTQKMGGVIAIDHYVKTPEQLNEDIISLASATGGKIVLGEYGTPIPDIHGKLSEVEQAEWLKRLYTLLEKNPHLLGLNYWVNVGGSTQIWNENGSARAAVKEITEFYKTY